MYTQIYKGLDIITAKATQEERTIAKHHLIDFLSPTEYFTVVNYRNTAVKIVSFFQLYEPYVRIKL